MVRYLAVLASIGEAAVLPGAEGEPAEDWFRATMPNSAPDGIRP